MISKIKSTLGGSGNRAQLLRGGIGALVLKILNIGLSLGTSIVLTRALGAESFGIYVYVFALVALFSVPAQFGMTTLIVRETVRAETEGNWSLLRGIWRWANITASIISVALIICCIIYFTFFAGSNHKVSDDNAFIYAIAAIPFLALSGLRSASLQGLRKIVQSQIPEGIIRPLILIALILFYWFFISNDMTSETAVMLSVLSIIISFIFGAWLLHRETPIEVLKKPKPQYKTKLWLKSVIPFTLLEGVGVINTQTDIVMLGIFGSATDVGLYRIASQGASITTVGLTVVAMAAMPYFARFYAQSDILKLSKVAVMTARASMLLAIPFSLLFMFYGDSILTIAFGNEFANGYSVLMVLTIIQLLNAMFGTSGRILNMTGHEQDTLKGMLVATFCNIVLNFIFIPSYGAVGAAWATGISILIRNIMLWVMVYHRLGIDTSVFGVFHNENKMNNLQKINA
ncbi:flippase [Psychrobacter urativorans]|uniref:Uncharacterized protein n=1 Tax=Psychrobacter urativorans TaxID=45610 RepID=A0A0M3V8G8_9GAMM|nr:flippase [Psychrobacter urativorans]ALF59163.1 hypothetical protein AOC03_03120 [Psychrobacter urativorans]